MSRDIDKNAQFTLRLPSELKEALQQSAKEQDIDAVVWIRHAIREKLERERAAAAEKETRQLNEEQLRDLMRGMLTEELDSRGIYSGTIKTAAVSSPETKFEKAALKQRSF